MLDLLTDPATWFVIGTILLVIELFDGSLVFFLPTGVAALSISVLTLLLEIGVPLTLVLFAGLSLVFFTATRYYMHFQKKDKTKDVNDY